MRSKQIKNKDFGPKIKKPYDYYENGKITDRYWKKNTCRGLKHKNDKYNYETYI